MSITHYFNFDVRKYVDNHFQLEFVKNPSRVFTNVNQMLSEDGVLVNFVPRRSFLGLIYKMFHWRQISTHQNI